MRRIPALLILLGGLALTPACTTSSDTGIPVASGSASASASARSEVAFANCVRQHGVNIPDPNPDAPWPPSQVERSDGWHAAAAACGHLLPPSEAGIAPQPPTAQQLEQLRTYAVCMRAHGIDMSDPTPTGGLTIGGRLATGTRAQLKYDPGFKAAQAACKDKLPGLKGKKL
jgi:hypothetical protein